MADTVTIVAYHYVRDLVRTRYPAIKGLELSLFREQLAYLKRHHTVITAQELIDAVQHGQRGDEWELPGNAALLTFDDGYRDHFENVFPLLEAAGVQGSFFPPVQAIVERRVLDVNKVHFVLAACPDPRRLVADVFRALDERRGAHDVEGNDALYARLATASRRDPPEVVFIKRALQFALPLPLRAEIAGELFARYVSDDEGGFAAELYMTSEEVHQLADAGMYVGSHTSTHPRLSTLSPAEQAAEIDRSLDFLHEVGTDVRAWVMCYPYGDANDALLDLLRARDCAVGLTTQPGIASGRHNPLLLPRLDTNDLPKRADAARADWTVQAGAHALAGARSRADDAAVHG